MVAEPVRHRLDEGGAVLGAGQLGRLANDLGNGEQVVAVALHAVHTVGQSALREGRG